MGCQALPSGACKDELSLGEIGKDKVVGGMPLAGQRPARTADDGKNGWSITLQQRQPGR